MLVERREAERRHIAERGTAIVDEGVRRLCDISDISSKGACLRMGANAPLPTRFLLVFADGRRVPCQKIWQEGVSAGVQFAPIPFWKRLVSPRR